MPERQRLKLLSEEGPGFREGSPDFLSQPRWQARNHRKESRLGSIDQNADKLELGRGQLSPLKVIREKCIDCSGGSLVEVRRCHLIKCALWPFRMGANPFAKPRGRSIPHFRAFVEKFPANSGDFRRQRAS
jgi:hypothetical protein